MAWNNHPVPRAVPTPQELVSLPPQILAQEIANVEAVLANRYNPNGTFAEFCDEITILGKQEKRVLTADVLRYRANLYTAQKLQATEGRYGIGLFNVRFHGRGEGVPRERGGY